MNILNDRKDAPSKAPSDDAPLEVHVRWFISLKREGVTESEILDYFELVGFPIQETTPVLQGLVSQGVARRNADRYILNP